MIKSHIAASAHMKNVSVTLETYEIPARHVMEGDLLLVPDGMTLKVKTYKIRDAEFVAHSRHVDVFVEGSEFRFDRDETVTVVRTFVRVS